MTTPFSNSIVGEQGTLVRAQIKSPNFSQANKTGWAILKNGDAYFFGLVVTADQIVFTDSNSYDNPGGQAILYTAPAAATNDQSALLINGPTDGTYEAALALWGESEDGTKQPYAVLFSYDVTTEAITGIPLMVGNMAATPPEPGLNLGPLLYAIGSYLATTGDGWLGPIAAIEPGTTGTPETWHSITLDSGWTAGSPVPAYRLLPDGNLQLAGKATHAAITTETALCSSNPVPAAYRPLSDKKIYQSNRAGAVTGASIDTTGIIYAEPAGVSGTVIDLTGITDLL